MFKKIKSLYITKLLFFYLDEGNKLELIKYNKSLQNKLDIDIINYKIYSGRYIIYEENRKGKEYKSISDKLCFEGEYINGKKMEKVKNMMNMKD